MKILISLINFDGVNFGNIILYINAFNLVNSFKQLFKKLESPMTTMDYFPFFFFVCFFFFFPFCNW